MICIFWGMALVIEVAQWVVILALAVAGVVARRRDRLKMAQLRDDLSDAYIELAQLRGWTAGNVEALRRSRGDNLAGEPPEAKSSRRLWVVGVVALCGVMGTALWQAGRHEPAQPVAIGPAADTHTSPTPAPPATTPTPSSSTPSDPARTVTPTTTTPSAPSTTAQRGTVAPPSRTTAAQPPVGHQTAPGQDRRDEHTRRPERPAPPAGDPNDDQDDADHHGDDDQGDDTDDQGRTCGADLNLALVQARVLCGNGSLLGINLGLTV